jgi:hypothetical protein
MDAQTLIPVFAEEGCRTVLIGYVPLKPSSVPASDKTYTSGSIWAVWLRVLAIHKYSVCICA